MGLPFLEIFPAEIRDQIYRCVLASPSGLVTLTPWSAEVARSLALLQTCRQIHVECKAIIWHDNGLSIRPPSQLSQHVISLSTEPRIKHIQHVRISLELMDRDELEWVASSFAAFASWPRLRTITLVVDGERPRNVHQYREELAMKRLGLKLDGRYFHECGTGTRVLINTGWPQFAHWGKQQLMKAMLSDSSRVEDLLREMHDTLGGELWVGGMLYMKNREAVNQMVFNPRNGEVRMILGRSLSSTLRHTTVKPKPQSWASLFNNK